MSTKSLPADIASAPLSFEPGTSMANATVIRVDHEMLDDSNRAVGGYVSIQPDGGVREYGLNGWAQLTDPDGSFWVRTYATRDGQQFGASLTRPTKCATFEEAIATGRAKLAGQRRRFAKKFGE